MNKTTIKIDGAKLRTLLERATGKTIYEIALESGYSKNVISNAVRKGYASSAVQNIARLYDIYPAEYWVIEPDPEPTEEIKGQISIDDIEAIRKDELKALIMDVFNDIIYNCEIVIQTDKTKGNRLFLQERGAFDKFDKEESK